MGSHAVGQSKKLARSDEPLLLIAGGFVAMATIERLVLP